MQKDQFSVTLTSPDIDDKMLPLTWAQENMWAACWGYGQDAPRLNLGQLFELPHPVPLAKMIELLSNFGTRYEILRTTFNRDARQQVVHHRIEVPVTVARGEGLSAESFGALFSEASSVAFDHTSDAPWRLVFACADETVLAVGLTLSHLAFDYAAASLFRQLILDEVADGGAREPIVAPTQAADLVRYEASAEMKAHSDQTLARWNQALAQLPAGGGIRNPSPGNYSVTVLQSSAVAVAAQAIAARTRTSSSTVIAAALSQALLHYLPQPPSLLLTVCSNRHYPDLEKYLGLALQMGYFAIPEVNSPKFDDYVRQCIKAMMTGFKNARYNNGQFRAEQFAATAQGSCPDLSFFFNDARASGREWNGLENEVETLPVMLGTPAEPEPELVDRWRVQDATFSFALTEAGQDCRMMIISDDEVMRPNVTADILNHIRNLLVTTAIGISANWESLKVTEPFRGSGTT